MFINIQTLVLYARLNPESVNLVKSLEYHKTCQCSPHSHHRRTKQLHKEEVRIAGIEPAL